MSQRSLAQKKGLAGRGHEPWPGDDRIERSTIPDTQIVIDLGQQAPRPQCRLAGRLLPPQTACCPSFREIDKSMVESRPPLTCSDYLLVLAAAGRGTQLRVLCLVACTKGPLLHQGRDPDGRVTVLERSEENPQLTWIRIHTLGPPPSSTLCRGMPSSNNSSAIGQDTDGQGKPIGHTKEEKRSRRR